jgi:N,N'-diacetyllegionaminate synthase
MIIAECCTNWTDYDMAKEMVKSAGKNGAGFAKFQLFNPEDFTASPHYKWAKAHSLTFAQAKELFEYGNSIGIEVFYTMFGSQFIEWCERIGVKRYKIACSFRDKETMDRIKKTGKAVIISTNGEASNISPVKDLHLDRSNAVTWLYCIPAYPATAKGFNKIDWTRYGFSDHTNNIDASKVAIARGAGLIEKHFVLEHNPQFPDDAWSMTPKELHELARWEETCRRILE